MATECRPISPTAVHRILAHLFPLTEQLPSNLISKRLLQRHHFLNLTPNNAVEYLAWPSQSEESHALRLDDIQTLPDIDDHLGVQYTADGEDLLAHIRINQDLRLVFLWEPENGWQYHNLASMPFPHDATVDFSDAYAVYSHGDFLQEESHEIKASSDDEDSYWNSYCGGDNHGEHPPNLKSLDETNSEDAYWARYSTIQGSADSTVPSPRPVKPCKTESAGDVSQGDSHPDRVIVPPTKFRKQHVEPYNPLEPPSPEALTHRLEALSESFVCSDANRLRFELTTPSRQLDHNISVPQESSYTSVILPIPPPQPVDGVITVDVDSVIQQDHVQNILKDSIKNLYKLWRSGRQNRPEKQDKELFISTIQHSLEEL